MVCYSPEHTFMLATRFIFKTDTNIVAKSLKVHIKVIGRVIFDVCIIDITIYLIPQHTGWLSTVYYMERKTKNAWKKTGVKERNSFEINLHTKMKWIISTHIFKIPIVGQCHISVIYFFIFSTEFNKQAVIYSFRYYSIPDQIWLSKWLHALLTGVTKPEKAGCAVPERHCQLSLLNKHFSQTQICNVTAKRQVQTFTKAEGMFQW